MIIGLIVIVVVVVHMVGRGGRGIEKVDTLVVSTATAAIETETRKTKFTWCQTGTLRFVLGIVAMTV